MSGQGLQSFSMLHHRITGINSNYREGYQMKPCVKCGSTDRYKGGDCRPCAKAYRICNSAKIKALKASVRADNLAQYREKDKLRATAYRIANPEKSNASCSAYRARNKDACNKRSISWAKDNPERCKLNRLAWNEANPDRLNYCRARWKSLNPEAIILASHNRRARKRGGKLSKGLTEKLYNLQHGKCACCGNPLGEDFHLDHIMPLALGGTNEDWNIQLLRAICNHQKHKKHPIDFMRERGFLL